MWTRKDLKQNAKAVLKKNYWMPFAVSLVYALLSGSSGGSSGGASSSVGSSLGSGSSEFQTESAILIIGIVLVVMLIAFVIAYAFSFFVSGPIAVGKNRYYMENREVTASFGQLFYGFTHHYLNNAAAMFTTQLFVGLWTLLFIIPGVIKQLAWSQVPYILAENPGMTGKRAREISERMTDGKKWEIFVLELSFIGWILLGALACGVGTFFVMPYVDATYAELYAKLRQNALESGYVSAEELPGFAQA